MMSMVSDLSSAATGTSIAARPEAVEYEQSRADGDRAVRDVECRPRPGAVMEQQEVDDAGRSTMRSHKVAERAAQDQRQPGAQQCGCPALQHPGQEYAGDDRDRRQQPARCQSGAPARKLKATPGL